MQHTLGTRYRVAWTMLQRFRVAMVRSERECLSYNVEVDETLIGGIDHGGKRGRGASKSIVAIAVKIKEPKGFGRLRMRHIPDSSSASLLPFVCDLIATGSTTSNWPSEKHVASRATKSQKSPSITSSGGFLNPNLPIDFAEEAKIQRGYRKCRRKSCLPVYDSAGGYNCHTKDP